MSNLPPGATKMIEDQAGAFEEYGDAPAVSMAHFEAHVAKHWKGFDLRIALAVAGEDGPIDVNVLRATRAIANIALGLAGEAGEAAEHFKKFMRPGSKIDRRAAALELGDALYYLSACATALGFNLSDIARMNIEKLNERAKR